MDRGRRNQPFEQEKKEFMENVIHIDRVSRVVKGGRRFRFRALVVVGDGKKRLGIGVSKGADVQAAIGKAVDVAKKNMITISTYKNTIPHVTQAKHSGANVLLKPASPGTGLIAGGTVRAVLDVTGIQDVLSKSLGSSNKVNVAYSTLEALSGLTPASEWVTTSEKKAPAKKTEEKAEDKKTTEKKTTAKKAPAKNTAAKKEKK
jgi:small subunit ribosomal protein S5